MNPFSDRPTIQQLTGEHHDRVISMDYHEMPMEYDRGCEPTRNYHIRINDDVVPYITSGVVSYWVRIGAFDTTQEVQVAVDDVWHEFGRRIGSFTLSYKDLPSPMSLDPAAVSRAIGEIILPHLRRHCPEARLPEA